MKWDDVPVSKHHLLDGGAAGDGAKADSDSDVGAESAILAKTGTVLDGQLASFVRRNVSDGKRPWAAPRKPAIKD